VLVTKRDVCAYKEQYPDGSQQNIDSCFSNLWGEPIHQLALCWSYSQLKKEMGE
jgi:hypothetical protein